MWIDLNADLGEGAGTDEELLALITSANISCGSHAGTTDDIRSALQQAASLGVAVGAHPGHPDRAHMGRRELPVPPEEVRRNVLAQVADLRAMADPLGVRIRYLKPHGGLYHQGCKDRAYGDALVDACEELGLPIIGLPGSRIEEAARGRVPFFAEGFADRGYRPDGSLIPREEPGALLTSSREAEEQAKRLIKTGAVRTVCVHGDTPDAVRFVSAIRDELLRSGVELRSFA